MGQTREMDHQYYREPKEDCAMDVLFLYSFSFFLFMLKKILRRTWSKRQTRTGQELRCEIRWGLMDGQEFVFGSEHVSFRLKIK